MPVSFYEVVWIFLIYAFLGWCTEVAYAALDTGKFVNRGFLNGPVCPVYGCGVLVVVVALTPLKEKLLILFIGSLLLTTIIEFITGFLLEKLFHNQWWDYSNEHFNLCGYICLKFSILWGLACTFIMDILHPIIYKGIKVFPPIPGMILLVVLLIVFCSDLAITVASILKFNKRLRLMDEIAARLKVVSDEIGENIYENVTEAIEKSDDFKEKLEDIKDNFQDNLQEKRKEAEVLRRKYKELMESKSFSHKRLLKAFPGMKSRSYPEALTKLKQYINEIKEKQEKK